MGTLEQYIKEIIEIIHFFGELCETDSICFIEKRMMDSDFKYDRYKNDILKLLTNNRPKIHSQNDLKTPILKLFDKIIVFDCVDLIEKKKNFFQQALNHLEKTAGKLIIIKKLRKWTTTFDEEQSGKFNTEWTSILTDLLDAGFNIQWDVIDIPINVNCNQWMDSMNNYSEGLIQYMHTSLRYIPLDNEQIRLNEQLLIIVAFPKLQSDYKLNSIKRSVQSFHKQNNNSNLYHNKTHIVPLDVTQMQHILDEKLPEIIAHSIKSVNKQHRNYRSEWWGTVVADKWVNTDSSRIPSKRLIFF